MDSRASSIACSSEYLRLKVKFGKEIRRFIVRRDDITLESLRAEITRIYGLKLRNLSRVSLKRYKDPSGAEFEHSNLEKVLNSDTPQVALVMEITSPMANWPEERKQEQKKLFKPLKLGKIEPSIGLPHPWPVDPEAGKDLPPIIRKGKKADDGSRQINARGDRLDLLDPPAVIAATYKRTITIRINGETRVIRDVSPDVYLAQYLRTHGFTGTKIGCGEGGCGACTVLLSFRDPVTGEVKHKSTNACMRLLLSCDGMEITNTTGIGNKRDGFHPLQEQMAMLAGTQCGFCTPGVITQMYSLLINNDKPMLQEVEDVLQGNLCRCTGYRPIYTALHQFALNGPLEEQEEKNEARSERVEKAVQQIGKEKENIVERLANEEPQGLFFRRDNHLYFRPVDVQDTFVLINYYSHLPMRLTVGNTSIGVIKYFESIPNDDPQVFIDVSRLPILLSKRVDNEGLNFGAAVTMNDVIEMLEENAHLSPTFQQVANHMKVVATIQIRNTASWVGNLMTAKTHPAFPSDLLTLFTTIGARIVVFNGVSVAEISMEEFFVDPIPRGWIVQRIIIPFASPETKFVSFKIRARDQSAHPIVNAGFLATFDSEKRITSTSIVFGGLQDGPRRVINTEKELIGKVFDLDTFVEAKKILSEETFPTNEALNSKEYRHEVAKGLFYKFFLRVQDFDSLPEEVASAAVDYVRPISQGEHTFPEADPTLTPVSEPFPKLEAFIQCSGEAHYTDDAQPFMNGFWAAPVISTEARATIRSIDISKALEVPGVVDFISAVDVFAIGGVNDIGAFPGDEELFATREVITHGQIIGLIITQADDSTLGEKAAKLVEVEYGPPVEPAVLTLQEGIARKNFFEQKPEFGLTFPETIERGDLDEGFAEADHVVEGTVNHGTQHHFYMETQSVVAVPDEDDNIEVTSASQSTATVNQKLSTVLGLPQNKIICKTRRVGGGFGGKISRDHPIIGAVAVAARRLNRPVRCKLDRLVDHIATGKRHEMFFEYKVGFRDDGIITALDATFFPNGGCTYDATLGVTGRAQTFVDNCYNILNYRTTAHPVRTNQPSNTSMRAPGMTNGTFFMENVIEHVARASGLDATLVREMNFYKNGDMTPYGQPITDSTLLEVWETLKMKCEFDRVQQEVDDFNMKNKFRKRGVAMVPIKFGLDQGGRRGTSLVTIHAPDGSVTVCTGGIEMGQGLNTKVAQAVALKLQVPFESVRVTEVSTDKTTNFTTSGGSAASEVFTQAAIDACDQLNERLEPFRRQFPADATMGEIASAAVTTVNLSATGVYLPMDEYEFTYFIWSAGVVVMEIDTITGEQQVLHAEIVYDAGTPLNPLLDLGQIEGAFVQGIGMATTEEVVLDKFGAEISLGTWEYKPPCSKTIPQTFNVTILDGVTNPIGVLGSKAVGEPPLNLGVASVFFALKNAIAAARADHGHESEFRLDSPCTVEHTALACRAQEK